MCGSRLRNEFTEVAFAPSCPFSPKQIGIKNYKIAPPPAPPLRWGVCPEESTSSRDTGTITELQLPAQAHIPTPSPGMIHPVVGSSVPVGLHRRANLSVLLL